MQECIFTSRQIARIRMWGSEVAHLHGKPADEPVCLGKPPTSRGVHELRW